MNLTCEARGYPQPQIMWRREDGRSITANGHTKKGITKNITKKNTNITKNITTKCRKKKHNKISEQYHKKGITKKGSDLF